MQNKTIKPEKTISLSNLPSIIIAVVLIIGIGAIYGLIGYLVLGIKENVTPVIQKPSLEITDNYFGNEFIQVKSPQKNATIKSSVLISGKANVYEANVRIRISDDNKNILANDFITAGGWMDKLYSFEKEIDYKMPQTEKGLIEIFEESAKDGSEIYKVETPVIFEEYENVFSDWKTYRNEEFGFEVKYPSNFILRERINEDHTSFIVGFIKSIHAHANTVGIYKYNSEEEVEKFKNLPYVKLYKRDGYYLAVWGTSNELSDQILSTFKFIEEDEIVDWKTYRNEEYGFELKYPGDWDNPLWQEDEYRKGITFGCPVFDFEGNEHCSLSLRISEAITKSEAIRNISINIGAYKKEDVIINEGDIPTIKEFTVDTREAITYHDAGICVETYTKIFDSKMTISFTDRCSVYEGKIFDQILSTFKFIEEDETADENKPSIYSSKGEGGLLLLNGEKTGFPAYEFKKQEFILFIKSDYETKDRSLKTISTKYPFEEKTLSDKIDGLVISNLFEEESFYFKGIFSDGPGSYTSVFMFEPESKDFIYFMRKAMSNVYIKIASSKSFALFNAEKKSRRLLGEHEDSLSDDDIEIIINNEKLSKKDVDNEHSIENQEAIFNCRPPEFIMTENDYYNYPNHYIDSYGDGNRVNRGKINIRRYVKYFPDKFPCFVNEESDEITGYFDLVENKFVSVSSL